MDLYSGVHSPKHTPVWPAAQGNASSGSPHAASSSLAKFWSGIRVPDRLPRQRRVVAVARILLPGRLPSQKPQQETCNESWMVDFSLRTLICDADEPRACLPRLHPPPPECTHTPPHLWVGSLKKKEKKKKRKVRSSLDFEGWPLKWSWGCQRGCVWNTDVNSNAKQRGQRLLSVICWRRARRETSDDPWDYSQCCDLPSLESLTPLEKDRCKRLIFQQCTEWTPLSFRK